MNANHKLEFVNVPPVTVDVARELMLHHMTLGLGYFGVLPMTDTELGDIINEVNRVLPHDDQADTAVKRDALRAMFETLVDHRRLSRRRTGQENVKPELDLMSMPAKRETMEEPRPAAPEKITTRPAINGRPEVKTRELTDGEVAKLKAKGLKPLNVNQQVACNILGVPCVRRGRGLYVRIG